MPMRSRPALFDFSHERPNATSNINAVQNIGLWYGNRNTDRRQRLDTRLATAQLPYLDIVWEVVVAVLPSVLNAFVV
jgi:hypothetical protein